MTTVLRTRTGISYEEIAPPEFSIGREGLSARRIFKIAWEDQDAFFLEFFPPPSVTRRGSSAVPDMATFPGRPYLIAQNVSFTAFDPENPSTPDAYGVATCDSGARVEVTYATSDMKQSGQEETADEDQEGQLIFSASVQIGGEYFTFPAHALKWELSPEQVNNPPEENQTEDLNAAKLIPTMEYTVTLHRVPELPIEIIKNTIGRVNLYYDRNFQAEPETLLFVGATASRKITTEGAEAWEIEYRFSHRVVSWRDIPDGGDESDYTLYPVKHAGWNHFIDPRDGKWKKLQTKSNDYIYNTADTFDPLFFPNADAEYSSSSSNEAAAFAAAKQKGFF